MPRLIKQPKKTSRIYDRWFGMVLSEHDKLRLIELTLLEFEKPIHERLSILELSEPFGKIIETTYKL